MLITTALVEGKFPHDLFLGWELSVLKARDRFIGWLLLLNLLLLGVAVALFIYFHPGGEMAELLNIPGDVFLLGWAISMTGLAFYQIAVLREIIKKKAKASGKQLVSLAVVGLGSSRYLLLKRVGKNLLVQQISQVALTDAGTSLGPQLEKMRLADERLLITGAFLAKYENGNAFLNARIRILHLLADAIGEGMVDLDQSVLVQLQKL